MRLCNFLEVHRVVLSVRRPRAGRLERIRKHRCRAAPHVPVHEANIAVIASPRIKVVIDGNTIPPPCLPLDGRGLRKERSWQHLLKPLLEGHRSATIRKKAPSNAVAPPRAAVPTVAVRSSPNHPDPRGAKTARSTNAVFWEMPSDLLEDASEHDNAPAFKHCQMRA